MSQINKIYYYKSFRTTIYGGVFFLIGLGYSCLQVYFYVSSNISSTSFFLSFLGLLFIGILFILFGLKILINRNKFVALELQNHQIKYLIIGTARFAGIGFFINQQYDTIYYSQIEDIEGINSFLDFQIYIKPKFGEKIIIPFRFRNRKEKEDILQELKIHLQNNKHIEN